MRVSPSQLDKFRTCSEMWHYSYIEKLQPVGGRKKWEKGTFTHELLHVLYHTLHANPRLQLGGPEIQNIMHNRIINSGVTNENIEIMSVVLPLITRYVTQQSPKIDSTIKEILGVELEFSIELDDITLNGFIDLVYRDTSGRIWIRDHKSSEKVNAWNQDKLKMMGQLLFYCLAMSIYFNEPVYNVEVNFLNTYPYAKPAPTLQLFKNFKHSHAPESIESFKENLIQLHSYMKLDPRVKAYNDSCYGCTFFELCHLGSRGNDISSLKVSNFGQEERQTLDFNFVLE